MPINVYTANVTPVYGGTYDAHVSTGVDVSANEEFPDVSQHGATDSGVAIWDTTRQVNLLYFDLSGIPAGSTINSAQLRCRTRGFVTHAFDIALQPLNQSFVAAEATHNSYSAGNAWPTDLQTNLGTAESTNTMVVDDIDNYYGWTATTTVDAIVNGSAYGFALNGPGYPGFGFAGFARYIEADGARPELVVDYTAPGGGARPGFTETLEVVGSPGTPISDRNLEMTVLDATDQSIVVATQTIATASGVFEIDNNGGGSMVVGTNYDLHVEDTAEAVLLARVRAFRFTAADLDA